MVNSNLFGICMNQQYQAGPEIFGSVFPDALQNADMQYLWNLGIRNVRIPLKSYGSRQVDIDWQRTAVRKTKEFGFNVTTGSGQNNGSGGHTPASWVTFHDFILNDEVPWLIAQGIFTSNDVYFIGNESEAAAAYDGVASISRTSNVVTVTYAYKHMMATGDGITCQFDDLGITNNQFGSERIVTVIDDYTFTFSHTGSDVATITNPSSSTNKFKYSNKTVFRAFKRLATLVKATGLPMKLEYSCYHGITQDNGRVELHRYYIQDIIDLGRGDLDYVGLNMYSYVGASPDAGLRYFRWEVKKGYDAFGADHFRVTEWNLWHNNDNIYSPSRLSTAYLMRRIEFMESLGIQHFFFNYREHNNLLVATKPFNTTTGQTWRDWWWPLTGQRAKTIETTFNSPISAYGLRRTPLAIIDENTGFNIGQYEQSGTYDSTKVNNDLNQLWDFGVRKLRVATGDASYYLAGYNACWNLALAAKAKGFYVCMALAGNPDDSTWDAYVTKVSTEAALCEERGIDELNIMNEIDASWSTPNLTNRVSKTKSLATTVQGIFNGVVSAALAQDGSEAEWIATGKGDLDKVGYNVYGSEGSFEDWKSKITAMHNAFGSNLYISEWNLHHTWSLFQQPETLQTTQISQRIAFLQTKNLFNYFFTWNWDHASDQFAMKKANGSLRDWKYALFVNPTPRRAISQARRAATSRRLVQ